MTAETQKKLSAESRRNIEAATQRLVDTQSFAGESNGHGRAPEGTKMFWKTRTIRGSSELMLGRSHQANAVQPTDGTAIVIQSKVPTHTEAYLFTKSRQGFIARRFSVDYAGNGVTLTNLVGEQLFPSSKEVDLPIEDADFAKVVNVNEASTSSEISSNYDYFPVTETQDREFHTAFNTLATIYAEFGAEIKGEMIGVPQDFNPAVALAKHLAR